MTQTQTTPTIVSTTQISPTRERALRALGITQDQVDALPKITPQLKMIQKTVRRGGEPQVTRRVMTGNTGAAIAEDTRHAVPYGPGSDIVNSWIDYLSSSAEAEALRVRQAYESVPRYLRRDTSAHLKIEDYCAAAGVSPLRILEILTATVIRLGVQASALVAAVNHPRVVQKTVDMAMTDDGVEDRATLHKHTGFLPTAKGPSTNIVVTQNAVATSTAQAAAVPPPEQTIRRLVDRFNQQRILPGASAQQALPEDVSVRMPSVSPSAPAPQPVEAELVEADEDDDAEDLPSDVL